MQLAARPAPWWTVFCGWCILLWYLSSRQLPDMDLPTFFSWDKVLHFGYFATGAAVFGIALHLTLNREGSPRLRWVLIVLLFSLIGLADEWHQTFTEGRQGGDYFDWIADTLGAMAGAGLGPFLARWLPSRVTREKGLA